MILAKLHRRKGIRYCSTPPPNPKNANATGGKPMAFNAAAGIRASANCTNVPVNFKRCQKRGVIYEIA